MIIGRRVEGDYQGLQLLSNAVLGDLTGKALVQRKQDASRLGYSSQLQIQLNLNR